MQTSEGEHRRQRAGAGPFPRPAGAPIGAGGELSPRRRPHHVLGNRRRVAAARRQPGPPQLDDPARRDRRRGARTPRRRRRGSRWSSSARAATPGLDAPLRRPRNDRDRRRGTVHAVKLVREGRSAYDTSAEIWLDPERSTCRRTRRCATAPAPRSTTSCSSASSPTEPGRPARAGLQSAPRAAGGAKERFAMHMLYNSDSFTVVAFDLPARPRRPAPRRPRRRAAASRSSTSSHKRTSSSRARWRRASRPASRR